MNSQDAIIEELWEAGVLDKEAHEVLIELLSKVGSTTNKKFSQKELERAYFVLSTLRNKNLVSHPDQKDLSEKTVAFFGLSVGSHAAITWILTSRAKNIKISDPDVIMPSNLNRLRLGWSKLFKKKTSYVAEELRDINPYGNIHILNSIDAKDIRTFLKKSPKVDAIIDEIDDVEGKILLRKEARRMRIPLLSATDVGDNVFLDIERYDTDVKTQPFLGRVKNFETIDPQKMTLAERRRMVFDVVGFEHNSVEMLSSLSSIGRTLITWPQLGTTATMSGAVIATALKKIFLGEDVRSNRYIVNMDALLDVQCNTVEKNAERNKLINELKAKFGLK